MKKIITLFFFAVVSTTAFSYEVPKALNYVNDYGKLLSQKEQDQLNQTLKMYQDSTSNQLAVLTLPSFDDQKEGLLFDFSIKVFRTWGIGQKSKNNGVLLVVIKDLASKHAPGLRIVTGYGLEGALPDIACKHIIDDIRPLINKGQYYQGIDLALKGIITEIKGEYSADSEKVTFGDIVLLIIVIIVILLFLIAVFNSGVFLWIFSPNSDSGGGGSFDGFSGGSSGGGGAGD